MIESNSGFQRHIIPASELKVVSDVTANQNKNDIFTLEEISDLPNPDETYSFRGLVEVLQRIAKSIEKIETKIK
jgi:hypothetical protein